MKLHLILLSIIMLPLSLNAETLNCLFDDYSQSSYPIKMAKSWVPENQKLLLKMIKLNYGNFLLP